MTVSAMRPTLNCVSNFAVFNSSNAELFDPPPGEHRSTDEVRQAGDAPHVAARQQDVVIAALFVVDVHNRLYIGRKWSRSWLTLLPRVGFYLVKGARNGMLMQTVRACHAAIAMASAVTPHRHSAAARQYIARNDTLRRCGWLPAVWYTCQGQPFP